MCGDGYLGGNEQCDDGNNDNSTPTGRDWDGNLAGVAERWYRFQGLEVADDLNVWVWLVNNPGDEFRLEVHTSNDTVTSCYAAVTVTAGCGGSATHYQWYHGGASPWTDDDSKTFYVRVYRRTGAPPTCNNFTLRAVVGGALPW